MRILLTGSSGVVGSAILVDLLKNGHRVTALDAVALPDGIRQILSPDASCRLSTHIVDLTDFKRLEESMSRDRPEGVIHLSAIPNPLGRDPRVVHNNNVTSSYNVLCTAATHGVKRIVQASSVNAVGLSYTPAGNQRFDALPLTEDTPYQTQDPYALSKHICEIQAASLVRANPDVRIASLRFHMVKPSYEVSWPLSEAESLYSWVSVEACARACILGLESEGWDGAEVFNIVADQICWEGGLSADQQQTVGHLGPHAQPGFLDLLQTQWRGRYNEDRLDRSWWDKDPRRAPWDCSKAERLMGWRHSG
ncbi:hypothetical protein JCM24511_03861 [Saitozyma sp. JCM 24511]|nr:hypothetical protein JCM24511_03861 [Saitozyma sp. JCM 24511]